MTPTIGISGIIAGVYYLYFTGTLSYFSNSIIFSPHEVTISITYCITWCLKFIDINRLINASYSLVVLVTLSLREVSEVSGLSTLSLPSWCFEVSSLYFSSSLVFFKSLTFSIESSRLVCYISYLSVCEVYVVSGL